MPNPGSVAPSSPVAGCPPRQRGWGTPSESPPAPGSSIPWAAVGGSPGTAARASDTSLALLLASWLPCSASPGGDGAPGWVEVAEIATAPGPWSWSSVGSRRPSTSTPVAYGGGGGGLLVSPSVRWPRLLLPWKVQICSHTARWSSSLDSSFCKDPTLGGWRQPTPLSGGPSR